MKKALLIFILFSQPIISELVLEITKGSDDPYSIAIIKLDRPKNINNQIDPIDIFPSLPDVAQNFAAHSTLPCLTVTH